MAFYREKIDTTMQISYDDPEPIVFFTKNPVASIKEYVYSLSVRSVAQAGSAPRWGCGGRGFKSRRSDHF